MAVIVAELWGPEKGETRQPVRQGYDLRRYSTEEVRRDRSRARFRYDARCRCCSDTDDDGDLFLSRTGRRSFCRIPPVPRCGPPSRVVAARDGPDARTPWPTVPKGLRREILDVFRTVGKRLRGLPRAAAKSAAEFTADANFPRLETVAAVGRHLAGEFQGA